MPFFPSLRPVGSFFFFSVAASTAAFVAASLNYWILAVNIVLNISCTKCFQQNIKLNLIYFFLFSFIGFSSQSKYSECSLIFITRHQNSASFNSIPEAMVEDREWF